MWALTDENGVALGNKSGASTLMIMVSDQNLSVVTKWNTYLYGALYEGDTIPFEPIMQDNSLESIIVNGVEYVLPTPPKDVPIHE